MKVKHLSIKTQPDLLDIQYLRANATIWDLRVGLYMKQSPLTLYGIPRLLRLIWFVDARVPFFPILFPLESENWNKRSRRGGWCACQNRSCVSKSKCLPSSAALAATATPTYRTSLALPVMPVASCHTPGQDNTWRVISLITIGQTNQAPMKNIQVFILKTNGLRRKPEISTAFDCSSVSQFTSHESRFRFSRCLDPPLPFY